MSNGELGPEESARLRELKEALESEFLESQNAPSTPKKALQDIEDLKTDFLGALKHVVRHSDSDALRAKVAMWGYDKLLEQGKAERDPIKDLIEGMEAVRVADTAAARVNNEDGS